MTAHAKPVKVIPRFLLSVRIKALSLVILLLCCYTGMHAQTTYTFNGNGYWSLPANWQLAAVPPDTLPAGSIINVNPSLNDSCVLDKIQVIAAGASLNILPGSNFIIRNGIVINAALPGISTIVPSGIAGNYALSGGNIISDGGSTITAKGVTWSINPNPEIATAAVTTDGKGSAGYNSYLRNLLPNTKYYIRAWATNSAGIAYGNELSFNTTGDLLPVVTLNVVDTIRAVMASASGSISSDLAAVTAHGFCWDTARLPTTAVTTKTVKGPTAYSWIWDPITDLLPKTTYFIRAYATSSLGTAYSNEYTFTTDSFTVPSVSSYQLAGSIDALGSIDGSVTAGGYTSSNGSPITVRGICWDTMPNPTITVSDTTVAGSGEGAFSSILTNLLPNKTYYIRPYASNAVGTGYGNTLLIRAWMPVNLDVVTYRNGDTIPQVSDSATWANLTTGAWCYYNNDSTNGAVYGKLYNWYAVNDPRGLAPAGWRLPNEEDWNGLVYVLGNAFGTAGGKMKATTLWMSPNTGATNSSRFTGLPGGFRMPDANFGGGEGYFGEWWSDYRYATLFIRRLSYNSNGLIQSYGNSSNITSYVRHGRSVRCVKE
ncbi:MAG: fibrobacter succinogenes major paralogous domain-containing protein [Ferruginibacter sp.]